MYEVVLSIGDIVIGKGSTRNEALKDAMPVIEGIGKYNTDYTTTIVGPDYREAIIWTSYKWHKGGDAK